MGRIAEVALRINPDIDARTHPKISTGMHTTKFGVTEAEAAQLCHRIDNDPNLKLVGLACHIGSQITDLAPLRDAAKRMGQFAKAMLAAGHGLTFLNMGGGLGIRYRDEQPPELEDYANTLLEQIKPTGLRLVIEPGRVVAGNSGILITRVLGVKKTPKKQFIIVDAAMTELVRPAFYGSYHEILPVVQSPDGAAVEVFDIVGPVCESSDVLGEERSMPSPKVNDLLYIRGCGGYGATMASNYNSRPRPAEVMVSGRDYKIARRRESLAQLWDLEI
jgi:diaminopimelate decarboxylase